MHNYQATLWKSGIVIELLVIYKLPHASSIDNWELF
jgi:hypothetical protein